MVWDLVRGPVTIGLVPPATRQGRIDHLRRTSDLAAAVGIPYVQTHTGFIPEIETDPLYEGAVAAIRAVASHCKTNRQEFLMETGQETPVTLLRAIQDSGLDNVGVGLDTANLILYGKGNPVDALDVLGKYIRSVHAKDGLFPTNPRQLGREVPIGTGRVDFVRVISRLIELGYAGAISIEREIRGPQQEAEILQAKMFLQNIINKGAAA
jgi:sugar phosphate isomerase/epimerase